MLDASREIYRNFIVLTDNPVFDLYAKHVGQYQTKCFANKATEKSSIHCQSILYRQELK